ncbi:3720_t:CDS:2 [Paraglomus brasilianum]|uniref:3720_t:CDS:1 n=1 Tax=Paraglomus brasilianum TaxID=144538 RepID=A0A9N8VX87_9GLOM|nr:3720_t:CDS:2 [Paraglomus brasilianum]
MSQFNFAEAFLLILIAGSIFAENLASSLFFGLVWYNVTQNSKQEQNNNAIRSLSEDFANKINELNEKIILIHDEVQTIREGDRFSNTSSFSHASSHRSFSSSVSQSLLRDFKRVFEKYMVRMSIVGSDMFKTVADDVNKEKGMQVIGAKAIESFYNGERKSDKRTIGAIKCWMELRNKEINEYNVG